jgi:hypothetical protein
MLLFAPKILKEIFSHLPTIILKSVNITEVLKEAGPFLLRFGKSELDAKHFGSLQYLQTSKLQIVNKITQSSVNQSLGTEILKLYFGQLKNENGLVLDMRSQHFSQSGSVLHWKPNSTWYQMKKEFREALIELYKSFYFDNHNNFIKALSDLGLSKGLNSEQVLELKELFKNHFGSGDQTQVEFDLETFNDSFAELFKFFVAHEVEIKTDFLFLGVYLITLYQNLEQIGGSHNVREAFTSQFPKP